MRKPGSALRLVVAAVILAAALLVLLSTAPMGAPAFAYRSGPGSLELKADPVSGVSRALAIVVPGTSRFEAEGAACAHRFDASDGKSREFHVELSDCFVPEAFHDASHVEVVLTGRAEGDVFRATQVEPQLGGCCGGPHCYR